MNLVATYECIPYNLQKEKPEVSYSIFAANSIFENIIKEKMLLLIINDYL